MPGVLARLTDDEPLDRRAQAGLVGRLGSLLGGSARRAGARAVASGRWLSDVVADAAPHVPVRDLPTLRDHYDGLTGDALATALVANASRITAGIGAAGGVLSSVEFAAPPLLLSAPVQIAAETLAVVMVEIKLLAELHEVYGRAVAGPPAVRGAAYLGAWVRRRGVDGFGGSGGSGGSGLGGMMTGAAKRELRQRLLRRAGRNAATAVPFLAGAVAGAALNRRETSKLGEAVVADLGGRLGRT